MALITPLCTTNGLDVMAPLNPTPPESILSHTAADHSNFQCPLGSYLTTPNPSFCRITLQDDSLRDFVPT